MQTKILLVDDERDIVEFLQYNLEKEGFEVITAFDGEEALEKISQNPDLIILDVLMPKMNGYEVCLKIKKMDNYNKIPIIFLTAKSSEIDEVKGLELGADDFIQKPVSPKIIIARIKSNLRGRLQIDRKLDEKNKIKIGPLIIDKEKYSVLVNDNPIIFPKKEFEILFLLSSHPGKVFHREQILSEIWGEDIFVVERTVDVHVRKIREKLLEYSTLIETIKGVGYRFKDVD
jgi:two-component system alkaline phosphatase synthesis response regulator PhoP